jgi:hypothetical protein
MDKATHDQIFAALAEDAVNDALLHMILRQAQYMDEREFWIQAVRILSRERRKVMGMLDRCIANSATTHWSLSGDPIEDIEKGCREPVGQPKQAAEPAATDEALLQRIVNMLQHGESVWAEPAYYDEILSRLRLLSPGRVVTLEPSINSNGLVVLKAVFQCSND